jgi:hypothetical protein
MSTGALNAGISSNVSLSVADTVQLAAGAANFLVDNKLSATVGGDVSFASAAVAISSGSRLDVAAAEIVSVESTSVEVSALDLLSLQTGRLDGDVVGDMDLSAGGAAKLTVLDASLNAYGSIVGAVANHASVVADSLQMDALEAVKVSSARVSVDAGRTIDVHAAENFNVRSINVSAEADDSIRLLSGKSAEVLKWVPTFCK